jgi:glc operon protein GlcG
MEVSSRLLETSLFECRFHFDLDLCFRLLETAERGIAAAEGNHMFYGQGAVPIFRQDVLIDACGVGGGSAQEDEDCARAGVEKL